MSTMSRVMGTYTLSERSFWGRVPTNTLNKYVTVFGKIFLVFPRILLLGVWNLLALGLLAITAVVSTRIFKCMVYCWCRGNLLIFGYWWIATTGKVQVPQDGSCIIISNHCGWMEAMYIMAIYSPSYVAKSSIRKIPIIGLIGDKLNNIWIDRFAKGGGGVTAQIINRMKTGGNIIAIFPEGTTSNGTAIVKFRTGAFVPAAPIVPLICKYRCTLGFDPIFCSLSTKWHILNSLAQPAHRMSVQFLPVQYPNEAEKNDPKLYALNCKQMMVTASGLTDTNEEYSDKLEWEKSVGYMNKELAAQQHKDQELLLQGQVPQNRV